jgi:hypothetical protein
VNVNPVMSFFVLAYLWLGLTVVAFIAGAIAHGFSGQGAKADHQS